MDPSKHSSSAYQTDKEKFDENYERLFGRRSYIATDREDEDEEEKANVSQIK